MKDGKFEAAVRAFQSRHYAEALNLFLPLAQSGNARAQCYVATMFQSGLGVAPDGIKAVEWYKKAAEQEVRSEKISAVAYNNLATMYFTGAPGIEPNRLMAEEFRQKAIKLGFEM